MQTDITVIDLMKMRWSRNSAVAVDQFINEIGGVILGTLGTKIKQYRFADANVSDGTLEEAPSGANVFGVTDEPGGPGDVVRVRIGGRAVVTVSGDVANQDKLVAATGGLAVPMLETDISLMSAVAGADASDDIDQTNLPDTVNVVCAGDETGNTVIIRGKVASAYTEEIVTLGTADTYTSTNTWSAVYSLETTAESVGTIDIEDGSSTGNLIPQIAGTTAARHYGAILTDDADDATGLEIAINAGGANTSDVVVIGTDWLGVAKKETFTVNGTTPVDSADTYRTVTTLLIGADGIAWNAGVTSQYDINVPNTLDRSVRGTALAAQTTAGGTVDILINSQGIGAIDGAPAVVFVGRFTTGGGSATESFTCTGVQATDVVMVTINVKGAVPRTVVQADYASANTVDVEFSGDPSTDHVISIRVDRP
jgi:hypothetical protein